MKENRKEREGEGKKKIEVEKLEGGEGNQVSGNFIQPFDRMNHLIVNVGKYRVFEDFNIYSGHWPLSVYPRCQCVYTMAGKTPALQQSSEKATYLTNTLYLPILNPFKNQNK